MSNKDNVIVLPVETSLDVCPDRVLSAAIGELEDAVVIGERNEGGLYFASSTSDAARILFLLELAKRQLMDQC